MAEHDKPAWDRRQGTHREVKPRLYPGGCSAPGGQSIAAAAHGPIAARVYTNARPRLRLWFEPASGGRPPRRPAPRREDVMTFKVQVGPPQISIHQGQTVLISEEDGQIKWPSERGLYFFDTRVVSSWTIYANGEPWELLNGGAISYYASRIFLTNRALLTEDGTIPPRTLGFTLSRSIRGGMHEDLELINHGMKPVVFQLEIALRCDFADVFEVKSGRIVRRGRITTEWSPSRQHLRTTYNNADFTRAVTISPEQSAGKAVYANGRLSFEIALDPGEAWHCCLLYTLSDGDRQVAPPTECIADINRSRRAETMA